MAYKPGTVSRDFQAILDSYATTHQAEADEVLDQLGEEYVRVVANLRHRLKVLANGFGELIGLDARDSATEQVIRHLMGIADRNEALREGIDALLSQILERAIGEECVGLCGTAEDRVWHLLGLSTQLKTGSRAGAFLQRVGRCYLIGFDPECAILCRSVLDVEFKRQAPDELCKQFFGDRGRIRFDLTDRIAVVRRLGRISTHAETHARHVVEAGNKAVHEWPKGDALPLIIQTMAVLRELQDSAP